MVDNDCLVTAAFIIVNINQFSFEITANFPWNSTKLGNQRNYQKIGNQQKKLEKFFLCLHFWVDCTSCIWKILDEKIQSPALGRVGSDQNNLNEKHCNEILPAKIIFGARRSSLEKLTWICGWKIRDSRQFLFYRHV